MDEVRTIDPVRDLLVPASAGDVRTARELLPLIYEDLRACAHRRLAREPPGLTLQATALVHEAYLRLLKSGRLGWHNRRHFFGAAAEAMRRILIDRARRHGCLKRGAGRRRVGLEGIGRAEPDDLREELLALDRALQELQAGDPQLAELVKLRYFAGLTITQTADLLAISPATVKRYWSFARAWLATRMRSVGSGQHDGGAGPGHPTRGP